MASDEEVQATAESLSDQISAAIAGLGLDQAIQVVQTVQDRCTAALLGLRDDYQLAIAQDVDIESQRPQAGRGRNDQLDEGGQLPTVQPIDGPADLMDLERQVGKDK